MKKLITTISIIAATATLGFSQSKHWDIKITPKTTQKQLDSLIKMLKRENIYLLFTTTEFKDGKLVKLGGSVAFNDPKGSPNASFAPQKLEYIELILDKNPNRVTLNTPR